MRLCVYTRLYVICTSLADGSSVICTCARILITLKFLPWNYIHTYIVPTYCGQSEGDRSAGKGQAGEVWWSVHTACSSLAGAQVWV